MNMQALMKQAQAMQKEITDIKSKIDETIFEGKSSLVTVTVKGTKEVVKISLAPEVKDVVNDDMEMLEDMIVLALNDAFNKIDKELSNKMGKYSSMIPGLM